MSYSQDNLYASKRLAESKRLVLGGSREARDLVFEHICATVASDRYLSICYPSLMENRLAVGIPDGVYLAHDYWILGPSYVDRTNPTATPRVRELTFGDLAKTIEADNASRKRCATNTDSSVAGSKSRRTQLRSTPVARTNANSAASQIRATGSNATNTISAPATPPGATPPGATPPRETLLELGYGLTPIRRPSEAAVLGAGNDKTAERIMTRMQTDALTDYLNAVPAVCGVITSNISRNALTTLQTVPDWNAAIANQDLIRLWHVLAREAAFAYDTADEVAFQIRHELQNDSKYRLSHNGDFMTHANLWLGALKHLQFADPSTQEQDIVRYFIKNLPDLPTYRELRMGIMNDRVQLPHIVNARRSLSLVISECIRAGQVDNKLKPIGYQTPQKTPDAGPSDESARILALTADLNKLKQQFAAAAGGRGGGGRSEGGGGGRGGGGRGAGGGRGENKPTNEICNKHSLNLCPFGDLCKFKHGPADPRWAGDTMKPEFARLVQQSLDISQKKKAFHVARTDRNRAKRINMLTQSAMAGAEDEEQA